MSSTQHRTDERPSILKQPVAVWAVAFAAVVSFMGIGLVDPILPAIASQLDASPSQVELLFTTYFAVTGLAMLVTGFVSSRIGAKRTLLGGLALVVVFSLLAGASGSVTETSYASPTGRTPARPPRERASQARPPASGVGAARNAAPAAEISPAARSRSPAAARSDSI